MKKFIQGPAGELLDYLPIINRQLLPAEETDVEDPECLVVRRQISASAFSDVFLTRTWTFMQQRGHGHKKGARPRRYSDTKSRIILPAISARVARTLPIDAVAYEHRQLSTVHKAALFTDFNSPADFARHLDALIAGIP